MEDFSIDHSLNELLLRIALVSAELHDGDSDRENLIRERTELVAQARARGLWLSEPAQ